MKESDLVDHVRHSLSKYDGISTAIEVPFIGRVIDLVILEGEFVTTVEFKIKNWRHALLQASDHRMGADFSYIFLPRVPRSDDLKFKAQDLGIGILTLDESLCDPYSTFCEAPRNIKVMSQLKKLIIRNAESSNKLIDLRELASG